MVNLPSTPKFRETLPADCPPLNAVSKDPLEVIRLVAGPTVTQDDFKSHAALGMQIRAGITPCRFASCSVFMDGRLTKLPRLKDKEYLAYLQIDSKSGKWSYGNSGHIDLWMYQGFDPVAATIRVVRKNSNA